MIHIHAEPNMNDFGGGFYFLFFEMLQKNQSELS